MSSEWRKDAACRRVHPDVMYPSHDATEVERAKQVCRRCPVADPCLQYAIAAGEQFGVWGGKTLAERALAATRTECRHCGRVFTPRARLQQVCAYCRSGPIPPRVNQARCGTRGGYQAHRHRGEIACLDCADANRAYTRNRRQVTA